MRTLGSYLLYWSKPRPEKEKKKNWETELEEKYLRHKNLRIASNCQVQTQELSTIVMELWIVKTIVLYFHANIKLG